MPKEKDPREEALAESQRKVKEQTEAAAERQSAQPTPTQEENDRAKLGVQSLEELDNKEPDGSPEETSPVAPPAPAAPAPKSDKK